MVRFLSPIPKFVGEELETYGPFERDQISTLPAKIAKILINSEMSSKMCDELIHLDKEADQFLKDMFEKSLLSARGYYRVLKTARTIADLEEAKNINTGHLAEAFQYRLRESSS